MMTRGLLQNIALTFVMVLAILSGCRIATPPVEFYTLTPLTVASQADNPAGSATSLAVGVGPLQIPKINDRPQIVTRTGVNRINVDEFHRWAGSEYEDFIRVVTMNLAALLQSNLVAAYPWEEYFDPNYRIFMEIQQFDGRLGEYAQLDVTWTITGREARNVLLVRKSLIKEPVQGEDYETFVEAKSRILATLSREIALAIREIHDSK